MTLKVFTFLVLHFQTAGEKGLAKGSFLPKKM